MTRRPQTVLLTKVCWKTLRSTLVTSSTVLPELRSASTARPTAMWQELAAARQCAFCAGDHATHKCRKAENSSKAKYVNCRQAGHAAWMKVYPIHDWELECLKIVCLNIPARFREGKEEDHHYAGRLPPSRQPTLARSQSPPAPRAPTPPAVLPKPTALLKRTYDQQGSESASSSSSGDKVQPTPVAEATRQSASTPAESSLLGG